MTDSAVAQRSGGRGGGGGRRRNPWKEPYAHGKLSYSLQRLRTLTNSPLRGQQRERQKGKSGLIPYTPTVMKCCKVVLTFESVDEILLCA